MPEKLTDTIDRFNGELDKIKEVVPLLNLSSMLPCCGQPYVLQGSLDRFATFAVERPEDVAVLADRILDAIMTSRNELQAARIKLEKYIEERDNDGTEDTVRSEVG